MLESMHDERPRKVPPALIPAALERAIAVEVGVDPRTVRRHLHGYAVRSGIGERVDATIARLLAKPTEPAGE